MPYIRWEGRGGESKPGLDILSTEVVTKAKALDSRQGYNVNSGLLEGLEIRMRILILIPTQVDLTWYQWYCPFWRNLAELLSCNRVFISADTVSKHWWALNEMAASSRNHNQPPLSLPPASLRILATLYWVKIWKCCRSELFALTGIKFHHKIIPKDHKDGKLAEDLRFATLLALQVSQRFPPARPSTYSFWASKPVYTKAFRPVSGSMWQSVEW